MNNNIKILLEEIKYTYTSLQMSLYLEFFIKIDSEVDKSITKLLHWIVDIDINFDDWNKYILRKDFINNWLEVSINKWLNFWQLWDMAIINSFTYIASNFKELIDNELSFKNFIEKLFIDKWYDYNTFYSILCLIRNISTHWSVSKNYILKEKDFYDWKKYHLKKWINKLDLYLNIVDELHKLNISIDINKIDVWFKILDILWWYQMLMFIELCMNIIFYYEEDIKSNN